MESSIVWGMSGLLLGLLLGGVLVRVMLLSKQYQQQTALQVLEQQNQQLQQQCAALSVEQRQQQALWLQERDQREGELRQLREVKGAQDVELREVMTRLQETKRAADEKQRLLTESEQRLSTQFENLANRIFEQSRQSTVQQNKQSLDLLLTPLREQLDGFRKQVQDGFNVEARERHTLSHEIKNLQQLNVQMAKEAVNLTNALKGNNKAQGSWGEVVLTRVLEASGLREGHEYETQVSIRVEALSRMQPDVIVHLPQDRDVVIDAKMSLVAYERYFNDDDDTQREQWLKEHVASIRNHIKTLSKKDYHQLPGLRTLDYVLLFIPVEPAFLAAIGHDPELINEALRHNIMLVSPTTLLVALRTISNLWRYEQQSQNAQLIAERASRLYDKLRLFVDDMAGLGQNLERALANYQSAMNKLAQGRGNLINQAESFRTLGVEIKRDINPMLVERSQQE